MVTFVDMCRHGGWPRPGPSLPVEGGMKYRAAVVTDLTHP